MSSPSIINRSSDQATHWLRTVGQWLRREEVLHLLFWLAALIFLIILEWPIESKQTFYALLVNLSFYATIVYLNVNYLFPQYLLQKRIGAYMLLFVIAALVATPIRSLVIYLIYDATTEMQTNLLAAQSSIFLSHITVGAASTMLKIAADWARTTREQQKLEAQQLQSELRFLRSQINPHFLFNTLNSLYALTLKKSDEAPNTVLQLSEMMRYMLYDSNARLVPLAKEIEYIRNYLDLERLRHGADADIRFELVGDPGPLMIAPLLFITFIENAFKHGMARVLGKGYVHIYLSIEGNELSFHLENMKPTDELVTEQPGGIGLINVSRRLELLYPNSHDLHTHKTDDTYSVDLHVSLNRENNAIVKIN